MASAKSSLTHPSSHGYTHNMGPPCRSIFLASSHACPDLSSPLCCKFSFGSGCIRFFAVECPGLQLQHNHIQMWFVQATNKFACNAFT